MKKLRAAVSGHPDIQSDQFERSSVAKIVRPLVTVDVVIFAIIHNALSVLLVKREGGPDEPFPQHWALPGGFVDIRLDETIEDCATRKLSEKTGVSAPYLEQLGSWGNSKRDPRYWSITNVYFALITPSQANDVTVSPTQQWSAVEGPLRLRPLAFDHEQLLDAALLRLRSKVEYTLLPASLMPAEFTLPEFQKAYETVLGRKLDRSAFRTRMISAQAIEETGAYRTGSRRPAVLYRLSETPSHALSATFRRST